MSAFRVATSCRLLLVVLFWNGQGKDKASCKSRHSHLPQGGTGESLELRGAGRAGGAAASLGGRARSSGAARLSRMPLVKRA